MYAREAGAWPSYVVPKTVPSPVLPKPTIPYFPPIKLL